MSAVESDVPVAGSCPGSVVALAALVGDTAAVVGSTGPVVGGVAVVVGAMVVVGAVVGVCSAVTVRLREAVEFRLGAIGALDRDREVAVDVEGHREGEWRRGSNERGWRSRRWDRAGPS